MSPAELQKKIEKKVHKVFTKNSYNPLALGDHKTGGANRISYKEGYARYNMTVKEAKRVGRPTVRSLKWVESTSDLEWPRTDKPQEPRTIDDPDLYNLYGRILAQGE